MLIERAVKEAVILKIVKYLMVMLIGVVLMTGSAAQDAVTLEPITDSQFGIQGVVPAGWQEVSPGFYAREAGGTTALALQAAPATPEQFLGAILPQLGLTEAPESSGTYSSPAFEWTLYRVDVEAGSTTIAVEFGLAEVEGTTYTVYFQTSTDEFDTLREQVFTPALDALAPLEATPEPDMPYVQEEVTFANGDVTLAGTLTLPEGDGPHPAVVLISGSGPQDRDETIGGFRPFRLLSDYLTRQGIAVLRYDDRGTAASSGSWGDSTIDDFTADAAAGIDYLLTRDEIDAAQIGLLGHSEGGYNIARLAATRSDVAFIIGLAVPAVSGTDTLMLQNRLILETAGASEAIVAAQLEFLPQMWEAVAAADQEQFEAVISELVRTQYELSTPEEQAAVLNLDTYIAQIVNQQVDGYFNNWFRSFLEYDPAPDWASVSVPVLAIFGGKDIQVDAAQNTPALETLLTEAENEDFSIITLPDANHLFQQAETGGLEEYALLDPVFTPDLLPTIGEWLAERVTTS